jgi:hypothetical protein
VQSPRNHPRSLRRQDPRVDFIILSHSLGPKEEIETILTPTMSLCRSGDLNNPQMSIKCSNPESPLDHPRSLRRQDPRVDFIILSNLLGPKVEIETGLTPTMSLCRPGDLNNPDMSIKCSNPESPLDPPRSLRRQDPRVDFISLSHSLGPKEEIETGLTPTMSLCRPGDLNNRHMSIKCSLPEITQDH